MRWLWGRSHQYAASARHRTAFTSCRGHETDVFDYSGAHPVSGRCETPSFNRPDILSTFSTLIFLTIFRVLTDSELKKSSQLESTTIDMDRWESPDSPHTNYQQVEQLLFYQTLREQTYHTFSRQSSICLPQAVLGIASDFVAIAKTSLLNSLFWRK